MNTAGFIVGVILSVVIMFSTVMAAGNAGMSAITPTSITIR